MNTGWNKDMIKEYRTAIINLLGNEYWLELMGNAAAASGYYKPTGKWILAGTRYSDIWNTHEL